MRQAGGGVRQPGRGVCDEGLGFTFELIGRMTGGENFQY